MLWEDLFLEHGKDFLDATDSGYPVFDMDDLENLLKKDAKEYGVTRVFALGDYSYGYFGGAFDYRCAFFLIDAAGNYASLGEGDLLKYFIEQIDERYFLDWLFDNGILSDKDYKRLQWDLSY